MRACLSLVVALTFFHIPHLIAGCVEGNCLNGRGIYEYSSGARFVGEFHNGRINGEGTLYFTNGDVYTGEWVNQYREGEGRMRFKNGNVYIGEFRKNRFQGVGTMNFNNGDRYTGNWVNNLPSGFGKYYFKSGERYEGSFVAGKFEGNGTMFYPDGARYEGEWKDNKKNGTGTLYHSNGKRQSGEWARGEFRENNRIVLNASSEVDESLRNCNSVYCATGRGWFTYNDGSRYIGTFQDGLPEGEGTVYYASGDQYTGGWSKHAPHGEGILRYSDGREFRGAWNYGKLIRNLPADQKQQQQVPQEKIDIDYSPSVKIWAVIVGVGRYKHMPSLKYTDDDAYQMYAFMKSPEGGALPDEQVNVLIDEDATHRNILTAMKSTLLRADENDVVIFYFSGHGLEGSFLPVDFDGSRNSLRHSEINDLLKQSKAKHKVVFADACHSGSLLAMKTVMETSLRKFYNAFESSDGGLALLMSSKSEEYSLEDGGLRSGIFSHFLVRGLKGDADTDRNKIVTIRELYNYVNRRVYEYTAGAQTPVLTGSFDSNMPVAVRI